MLIMYYNYRFFLYHVHVCNVIYQEVTVYVVRINLVVEELQLLMYTYYVNIQWIWCKLFCNLTTT